VWFVWFAVEKKGERFPVRLDLNPDTTSAVPHLACRHLLPNAENGISPAEAERAKR